VLGIPVVALGAYEGALALAVRRFKYDPRPELSSRFARELARNWPEIALDPRCVLVPIPLFPKRLVERGFNQSALLAGALARLLGCRHSPRLLARVRETGRQAELDRRERAANVAGAFALCGRAPHEVVLVDDVVTTGETSAACVRVLEALGVNVVAIATIARTPGRSRIY
jgi:ComF family protein